MTSPSGTTAISLALALALVSGGCATAARHARSPAVPRSIARAPAWHEEIRARTETDFPTAVLYKPDDASTASEARRMAPLIVVSTQEVAAKLLPPVFTWQREIVLAGRTFVALEYTWPLIIEPAAAFEPYRLSLLLGDDGFPLVAAALRPVPDGTDSPLVFVSASLEAAARERFGDPLPGRAFAVEAALDLAPDALVAGVFEDGPMPLGPYVYIEPAGRGVTTILCRCSPAQFDAAAPGRYYTLAETTGDPQSRAAAVTPDDTGAGDDPLAGLQRLLRWPSGDDTNVAP